MIKVGLASYNFRQHVASDIPIHGQYVEPQNLKTQEYINTLDTWSDSHRMKLNEKKTKIMIINFTNKYQFTSRMKLRGSNIEQVREAKVLGTVISDDLSWTKNCSRIIKKCNMRLQLLRQVASFGTDKSMMKQIYTQVIRVILEGSCQVWRGSLTFKNRRDHERCQKLALKIICPTLSYKAAMVELNLDTLENRRQKLTTNFARFGQSHPKLKHLFTRNNKPHIMKTRKNRTYTVIANTNRLKNSPIMNMQRIINKTIHE